MMLLHILQNIESEQISNHFDQIAQYLFQDCQIYIGDAKYQLTEIEFYYYDAEKHPDSYAHKNDVQLDLGNWYFHGSGLDITFGNRSKKIYGGILIRGVKNLITNEYISGPINALRAMMRNFQSVTEAYQMQLVEGEPIKISSIIKSSRIGLNPKRDQKAATNYHQAPYRYLIDWEPSIKGHGFKEKLKVRKQGILCTFVEDKPNLKA
jgi:hypothetical protein